MTIKVSTVGLAAKKSDDLLPEGRRWPPKGHQHFLQKRDQITYILRTGDDHQRVNSRFCRKETRSLTSWGDGHQRVRSRFCSTETRSLTS